jgi:hypothetical protein
VREARVILICAVERTHGNQMHDVPTDLSFGINVFDGAIDKPVDLFLAVKPEIVPGNDLGIFKQHPPESNEAAVLLARLARRLVCPTIERDESFAGSFDIDALLFSSSKNLLK